MWNHDKVTSDSNTFFFVFTLPLHASPRLGRDPATDELSAFEAPPSDPFHMSMDEIKWSWTIEREDERNEMWTSKLHMRHVQENRKYCNRGVDWAAADVADGTKSDMLFPVCGIASQREQKGSGSTARKLIKKKSHVAGLQTAVWDLFIRYVLLPSLYSRHVFLTIPSS